MVKISRSRSSGIGLTGSVSSSSPPPSARSSASSATRRPAQRRSVRIRSSARLRAAVTIQAAGLSGSPRSRPALERDQERVLHRLLGAVEVAEDAGEDGDRLPRLAPEQAVDEDGLRSSGASASEVAAPASAAS